MAKTSPEQMVGLSPRFIKLCRWFWEKKGRMWGLIFGNIATFLIWLIGFILVTKVDDLQALPLYSVINYLAHNSLLFSFIIIIIFLLLLFFTAISYIVNQFPESALPTALQEEQHQQEKKQSEQDVKQIYLRWLGDKVSVLPRLGLGADLITPQSVELADIFIPLELQASPKALRLQPLDQDELKRVAGLNQQQHDYLLVDEKGEWERELLTGKRIDIETLWSHLSQRQPAAVIQGAPGMGKSTLLARITLSMALQGQQKKDPQLPSTPVVVPILIFIKEYADFLEKLLKGQDRSLLKFLLLSLEKELSSQGVEEPRIVVEQSGS